MVAEGIMAARGAPCTMILTFPGFQGLPLRLGLTAGPSKISGWTAAGGEVEEVEGVGGLVVGRGSCIMPPRSGTIEP
jgi:hypothetical protein